MSGRETRVSGLAICTRQIGLAWPGLPALLACDIMDIPPGYMDPMLWLLVVAPKQKREKGEEL
jgi:hypothetical protein